MSAEQESPVASPPEPRPAPPHRVDVRTAAGLLGLLALALLLRLWGLDWGAPDAGRYYPYHPDETVLLDAVCRINPLWGNFTPSFYNYGTLYITLCRLAYDFAAPTMRWGTVPRFSEPFPLWVGDFRHLLLLGRLVAVALGVGTVAVTWATARRLFGERAAWLAGLFLAVAPMHVLIGHYMAVDVPAAFFSTLAIYCAVRALEASGSRQIIGWILAAGAVAGLGTGTKYSSITALLPMAVPLWRLARGSGGGDGKPRWGAAGAALAGAVLLALLAFLLSTPGALLETGRFVRDLQFEMRANRLGLGLLFVATPPAAVYHLLVSLPVGLEWPLFLLSLAGGVWAMRRRTPGDLLLLLFLFATYLALAPAARKFLRYVIPLLPVLAILAARLVDDGLRGARRPVWAGVGAVAGAAALLSTVAHLGVLARPDARTQAAAYLREHGSGAVTALADNSWFYTPPLHPTAGCVLRALPYGGPPVWEGQSSAMAPPEPVAVGPFRVLAPQAGSLTPADLQRWRPKFVLLSDYEYEDPLRIKQADPSYHNGLLELLPELERGYHVVDFRPRPSILGFTWWRHGTPPHDWRYYMPEVRVYERNP